MKSYFEHQIFHCSYSVYILVLCQQVLRNHKASFFVENLKGTVLPGRVLTSTKGHGCFYFRIFNCTSKCCQNKQQKVSYRCLK